MSHYRWDWFRFGLGIQIYKNTFNIVALYMQVTFLQLYIVLYKEEE